MCNTFSLMFPSLSLSLRRGTNSSASSKLQFSSTSSSLLPSPVIPSEDIEQDALKWRLLTKEGVKALILHHVEKG